jgi:hypothetical protein
MFLLYFFLCIPLFIYAVSIVMEIRKRRRKVRRCFKCGHIGSMEPYLMGNKPYFLTISLLCLGIIPGLVYLGRVRKKYRCGNCGKITAHVSISEALADT